MLCATESEQRSGSLSELLIVLQALMTTRVFSKEGERKRSSNFAIQDVIKRDVRLEYFLKEGSQVHYGETNELAIRLPQKTWMCDVTKGIDQLRLRSTDPSRLS